MVDYLYTPVNAQDLPSDLHDEQPEVWWHATCYSTTIIALERYDLVRATPKGRWVKLHNYNDPPVWRPRGSRWMSNTKEGALRHLLARKASHVWHATRRLKNAERELTGIRKVIELIDARKE